MIDWSNFHFLRPWWLYALLPAAILLGLLWKRRLGRGAWRAFCDAELLPFILQDQPATGRNYRLPLAAAVVSLTVVALAGPTWQRLPGPAFRNESALVIALDLSRSMDATDIKPSRIAKARYKIADLLKQRKDGQTALLVYGGDAFTVTPLTNDVATIDSQLTALTTDIMPSPGTNAGVAIRKAAELLQQAGLAQGHILLVCDGIDSDSAALAEQWLGRYRLSVLGIGTGDGAPIPVGGGGFLKDADGNIVVAKLDAGALQALADAGRGLYRPVGAGDEDVEALSKLFNNPNTTEPLTGTELMLQQWDETGPWLVLLLLPWAAWQFRKGLLFWAALALLPAWPDDAHALEWQSLWRTPDQQGRQAFDSEQYDAAASRFENPEWRAAAQYRAGQYREAAETLKSATSADGHYNRGNALARAGDLSAALEAYQQALKLQPDHADARYNKELIEKQLAQQQQPENSSDSKQDSTQAQPGAQNRQQPGSKQDDATQSPQPDQQGQPSDPAAGNEKRQSDTQSAQADDQQRDDPSEKSREASPQSADSAKPPESTEPGRELTQPTAQPDQAGERDETERANAQLLKRIPDEPTGLLKRKFKYQYGQRNPAPRDAPGW